MDALAKCQAAYDAMLPDEDDETDPDHNCKRDGCLFVEIRRTSAGVALECRICGAKDCEIFGD